MLPRFSLALFFVTNALWLSGCASTAMIDYDRTALSQIDTYQTFTLEPRVDRSKYQNVVLSPIVDRRIEAAIVQELLAKGYQRNDDNPDFRVTFDTKTKTKKRVDDVSVGPTPFRRYPYYGYAGYSTLIVQEYEEGSFVIDIIDESSRQLVWRGAYSKELGWSAPDDKTIQKIVDKTLGEFPPEMATAPR